MMIQSILSSFFLSSGISILNLNEVVGNALGIGTFAGGMLISVLFILAVISLPIYKKNVTAIILLGVPAMGFCIAVQWLSIFFLVVVICAIAFGVANTFTTLFKEHAR